MAKDKKASAPAKSATKTQGSTSVNSTNHGVKLQGTSVNADATRSGVAKSHSIGGRSA